MTTAPTVTFTRYDGPAALAVMDSIVVPVYEASHGDVIDNPFYSSARFAERVRGYTSAPGFELATATIDGQPVGQAFGYSLPVHARWWNGLTTPAEPGFTDETGTRTFALCELMITPAWQARGVAHALHNELLSHRPEQRATLLVREDNQSAQRAYAKWGWHQAGKLQPYPDSPHYDALILPLPPS